MASKAKVLFSQLIHHKHLKTSLRNSNRTAALLTDGTRISFDKGGKKNPNQNKKPFTKKKIITVSRCDENRHWHHKYLDCVTL